MFTPENELEQALIKAATDPACRHDFYREFLDALIFVIPGTDCDSPPQSRTLPTGSIVSFEMIESAGDACIVAFTSLLRLRSFIESESSYFEIGVRDLIEITNGTAIMLNPGADYGKHFTSNELTALLDGSLFTPGEKIEFSENVKVSIGQPQNYPHELVKVLKKLYKNLPGVEKAYLAHIFIPGHDKKPHSIIGIVADIDQQTVVSQSGLAIEDIDIPDPPVDFIRITGAGGLDSYFINSCRPFYSRKKKLFGLFG